VCGVCGKESVSDFRKFGFFSILKKILSDHCEPYNLEQSEQRKMFVALFNHLKYKYPEEMRY
jgi:hypothetical protein